MHAHSTALATVSISAITRSHINLTLSNLAFIAREQDKSTAAEGEVGGKAGQGWKREGERERERERERELNSYKLFKTKGELCNYFSFYGLEDRREALLHQGHYGCLSGDVTLPCRQTLWFESFLMCQEAPWEIFHDFVSWTQPPEEQWRLTERVRTFSEKEQECDREQCYSQTPTPAPARYGICNGGGGTTKGWGHVFKLECT